MSRETRLTVVLMLNVLLIAALVSVGVVAHSLGSSGARAAWSLRGRSASRWSRWRACWAGRCGTEAVRSSARLRMSWSAGTVTSRIRAADLYLATVGGGVRLVGVDVGFGSLLRRLGPARWRTRPTPEAVIDWASVQSSFREARLFLGLFTGQIVIGAGVALIPGNLIQLLVQAQVLSGIITPSLITGRPLVRSGLRQLGLGALAVAVTYGVGSLIGSHGIQ